MPHEQFPPLWQRRLLFWLPKRLAGRFVTLFTLLFVFIFLLGGTLTLTGLPGTSFQGWIQVEKDQAFRTLNKIADLEQSRLNGTLHMLRNDAKELAHSSLLLTHLEQLTLSEPPPKSQSTSLQALRTLHELYDFATILRLVSYPDGVVRLSTDPREVGRSLSSHAVYRGTLETRSDYMGDAELVGEIPMIVIGHPLEDTQGKLRGVLMMEIPLPRVFAMLPGTGSGPWSSQETLLINTHGDLLSYVHTSSPVPSLESEKNSHLPILSSTLLAKANQGDGLMETVTTAGVPVLSAYRHIRQHPGWNWVLSVQVERQEAFESITRAVRYALLFGAGAILLFAVTAFYLARHLTQPLRQLTKTAQRLIAGERTVRTGIRRQDEVGVLAISFDAMLETVQENLNTLETRVEERTRDLSQELALHRQTEQRLRESETRMRQAVLESPFPAILHAEDGEVMLLSRAWTELSGYTHQDLATTDLWMEQMFPAESVEKAKQLIHATYTATERQAHGERAILTKDGRVRLWEFHSAPLGRLADQRRVVKCMAVDVTERRQAMDDLAHSERMLAEAQSMAHMGNWEWEITSDHLYWSEEIYRIFGLEKDRFAATFEGFLNTVHPEDRPRVMEAVEHALADQTPYAIDHRILLPNGALRHVQERGQVIRDEQGHPLRMIGTVQDQTEQHQARQRQLELERRLQHTQKMEAIGTLAGGIAHDFNNILSGILGYVELTLMDLPPGSEPRAHVEEIFRAALRARDLVAQLLAFSRRSEVAIKPLNLTALVKESMKFLRATIPSSIEVQTTIGPEDLVVQGDPTQIHQVILNLCTNAIHAMNQKNGILSVTLEGVTLHGHNAPSGLAPGPYVHLAVKDNGCGIPPELMHRIFDPFFTTKEVGEGSGLGLAVVHGIVESHHGSIFARSLPGKGSTFHCYLPMAKGESLLEKIPEEAFSSPQTAPLPRGKILLVDDQPQVLMVLERMLQTLGYDVTALPSSHDALRLFQEHPTRFDILFTDHGMPIMSGMDLGMELKQLHPPLQMLLCTGHATASLVEESRQKGFDRILHKPVTLREIKETMDSLPARPNSTGNPVSP